MKKPDLLDLRTHLPEKAGLLCAKIFGPITDYACLCGKYSELQHRGAVCEKCGVEVIGVAARTTRIGHVELAIPVLHPWLMPFIFDVFWPEEQIRHRLVNNDSFSFKQYVMHVLPILPPALRPLGDDVNDLYRRVINRNNRLRRLEELSAPSDLVHNERIMVQEAVEQLFDNEHVKKSVIDDDDQRKLRSLGSKTIEVLKATPEERIHLTCMGFV